MHKLLLLLFVIFALGAGKEENLLENGGFEKGMKGWLFINSSGNSETRLDRKKKKEGKQSLHLEKKGGPPFDMLRTDLGRLPAGKKVTVQGLFAGEGIQNGWFKIFFYDKEGNTIKQGGDVKSLKGTYAWKEIEITNKVPEGTENAAVFLLLVMEGELWVDGVKVFVPGVKKETKKPLDRKIRSWLDRNAVSIDTLDFEGSMNDLKPMKRMLKKARFVQLGEQSHGDGETFRAKARLVRFLHKEMGFEVLAFESGLFECERANALFEEGKVREGMETALFGIWRVEETLPMFEYLAASKKPLRLTGFDTRGSGTGIKEFLPRLYEFMGPQGALTEEEKLALRTMDDLLDQEGYKPGRAERMKGLTALDRLRSLFDQGKKMLIQEHGERKTAFYSQCLDNYMVRERFEFSKNDPDPNLSLNIRDERMAENLKWLAEERYPGKKIICWAATSHQAHHLKKVTSNSGRDTYQHWKNMGQYLHEWYGDQVYTIAFAAYEGEGGIFSPKFVIPEPREGSLEDHFFRYGKPYLFVDLRKKNPFNKPLYCSPMSYNRTIKANWPEVVDALFYIQEMTPTRFMGR